MKSLNSAVLALAVTLPFSSAANADDKMPTADERSKITSVLEGEGFSTWSSIELDDGRWEVDNAIGGDGKKYDLKLNRETFAVMSRELDD